MRTRVGRALACSVVSWLSLSGCGGPAPAEVQGPSAYVLDFTHLEGGAMNVGTNDWLVFPVDLREHRKVITMNAADQATILYARSFCDGQTSSPGSFHSTQADSAALPSLSLGHVDDLTVEVGLPLSTPGTSQPSPAFCYGARTPGAGWTWHLDAVPITFDGARRTSVGAVLVDADADAFTLIFNYPSAPAVRMVALHAHAQP